MRSIRKKNVSSHSLSAGIQGVGRVGFSRDLSPCLAEAVFSLRRSSLALCMSVFLISSLKDAGPTRLGATHMTSLYPSYPIKGSISKYSHVLGYWGSRLQCLMGNEFGGNFVQPQIPFHSGIHSILRELFQGHYYYPLLQMKKLRSRNIC